MTRHAAFFDDDYFRVLEPFHPEAEARAEVAAIREQVGLAQSDRVLDLGCGWGRHLALLREAGHDVIGLDLSLPLLRRSREQAVVAGDMRRLPFPEWDRPSAMPPRAIERARSSARIERRPPEP